MSFIESKILTYNGLSTDVKPTNGAGDDVLNGSRFREVDTDKTYHFNLSNDAWYEINDRTVLTDGTNDASINEDGQLHVVMEGKVDTENTTTTPLLAGGIFTGGAVNILPYSGISILIGTDQVGILTVQYGPDGLDWHSGESYDLLPGANKFFTPPVQSAFYRLIFENGPVNQGVFYIHPILKKSPIKWSSHNIDMPIVDQDDAELVKAVITGKKVNGDYDNVSLTNGANMKVSLEELESDISVNSNTQLKTTLFDSSGNELKLDQTTRSVCTTDYPHCEIHSGDHYYIKEVNTLALNNVLDIQFTPANTLKWPHWELIFGTSSEFEFWLYEDVTINTVGTSVPAINRNRNSVNIAGMVVNLIENSNISNANADTVVAASTLLAHGKVGSGRQEGGGGSSRQELVLKQNIPYSMRFAADAAGYVDWLFDWYEHTNN